jgi:hypothetical protein
MASETKPTVAAAAPVTTSRPYAEAKAASAPKKKTGVMIKVRLIGSNAWLGDRIPLPDGRTVDTHKLYLDSEVFMVDETDFEGNDYDKVYETPYTGKYPGVYRRRGKLQRVDPSTPLGVPPPAPKKVSPFRGRR